MLRIRLVTPVLALALGACGATHHQQIMSLEAIRQPTAEHKLILDGVGTWEGTLTSWNMPGAGPAGTSIAAKEVIVPVGEFFRQSTMTCDFGGMSYLGMGCVGYDPECKKVVGTWFDNTSSFLAHLEGELDAKGKTMVTRFESPDEMTGVVTPHRIETVFGNDTYTSTFFKGDGAGTKTMVIAMKRTGGKPGAK